MELELELKIDACSSPSAALVLRAETADIVSSIIRTTSKTRDGGAAIPLEAVRVDWDCIASIRAETMVCATVSVVVEVSSRTGVAGGGPTSGRTVDVVADPSMVLEVGEVGVPPRREVVGEVSLFYQ